MKLIDLDQNTDAWESFRRTHIGGSDAPIICNVSPYKKPKQLLLEKFGFGKSYSSSAMERGKALEPILRDQFCLESGINFTPLVGVHDDFEWISASFDGYSDLGYILEIKTCSTKTLESLEKEIRIDWMYQIQHQLFVSGLKNAFLFASDSISCVKREISRDNDLIAKIKLEEEKFARFLFLEEDPDLLIDLPRPRKKRATMIKTV